MSENEQNRDAGPAVPETVEAERAPEAPAIGLAAQLEEAQARAAEYLDNWRRAAAELSNARKRMLREQEEMRAAAAERVLERLLPIADDIERAFTALPPDLSAADKEWLSGFRAIQRKLQGLLEAEGVKPIETSGQMFDPLLHHAVTHEEAEGYREGEIIAEVSKGYALGDKVLRPSMVRVSKGS